MSDIRTADLPLRTWPSDSPFYCPSPTCEMFIGAAAAGPPGEMRMLMLMSSRGEGKALQNGTLVLTPTGWVKIEDLGPGDVVISRDGTPASVLGVYPQPAQPLWRIRFSDGTSAVVTADHLWAVETLWDRQLRDAHDRKGMRSLGRGKTTRVCSGLFHRKRRNQKVVTTSIILEKLRRDAWRYGGRWSIPLVNAVRFPTRTVPLDPYVLGALLGDGGITTSVMLSSADPEIIENVRRGLPDGDVLTRRSKTRAYDWSINGTSRVGSHRVNKTLNALRGLEVFGAKSEHKFIPEQYLWNDRDTRLSVLQGLLDTDGWVSKHANSILYSSVSEQLTQDVEFLVRSLGGTTRRQKETTPHYTYKGEQRDGRSCCRVTISLPDGIAPFRLTRKLSLLRQKQARGKTRRFIVGAEPVGEGLATCITVDHPDGCFVVDDFVVTHNSTAAIYACLEVADRMSREGYQWALPLRVAVIRDTWINLQRTTLVSFEQARAKGLPLEFADGGRQITLMDQGRAVIHWVLFGIDQPKDVDNLQGFQCGVLWPEEVAPAAGFTSGVPKEVLGVGVTSLRQEGVPWLRVLLTLNPPDSDHWLLRVQDSLEELGLRDVRIHQFTIPTGEKSRHFAQLAREAPTKAEADAWQFASEEFDRYRDRNIAFLTSIGRDDLVKRLGRGEVADVQSGEPVIPIFSKEHVAKELPVFRGLTIYRGWDNEPAPAVALFQILPEQAGINVLGSHAMENMHMEGFIDAWLLPFMQKVGIVPRKEEAVFGRGSRKGFGYEDICDPVLLDTQLSTGRVIMAKLGTTLRPGPVAWEDRRGAALACFNRARRGGSRWVQIEGATNDLLVKGLSGRFRYPRAITTGQTTMTVQAAKRVSGVWSNACDALFYGLAAKFPAAEWLRQQQRTPTPPGPRPSTFMGA